jgi:hypothetical protein
MNTQTQVRLNRVVADLLNVEHSFEQNKIGEQEALRKFNKAFDTLIDIRYDCPDEDIEGYVSQVWGRIEKLTLKK